VSSYVRTYKHPTAEAIDVPHIQDATPDQGHLSVRAPTEQAIWGRLASVDASEERDRLAARPLAQERSRLFDQQAEAYDRFRPTYPDAVIDELLGPVPAGLDVLDVGCGTGIASRQMAQRGAKVLGVELAPRMAEIARGHGVEVEIAAFEGWDAAGRTFDRVTSAQAWHWLDLPIATAKAASVLRPGGRLGLIWNAGCQPDDLADALEEVYASVVPRGGHRLFRGYAANRSSDVKTGLGSEIDAVSAVPDFGAPTEKWFPWTRAYQRDEWLDQLVSRSDHAALEPAVRDRLFEAIGAAIDDQGGSFVMNFETVLITATRLG
jgi:SAM-dependent methyltransferase